MDELETTLLERLCMMLIRNGVEDVAKMRNSMIPILADFDIRPKEKALVVYTEGKNEIFLKKFLLAKAVKGLSKRSLDLYRTEIYRSLLEIGKDADTITALDVQIHLAKVMQRGCSKCYCDNVRRQLSTFFAFMAREGYVRENIMLRVDNVKFTREKEKAFTDMEIELLREACKTTMERAIMEVLLSTAMRASELVSIKKTDLRDGEVSVLGKGGKYRTVYINAKAQVALRSFLTQREDDNPYVFPGGVCIAKSASRKGVKKEEWFMHKQLVDKERSYSHESVNALMRNVGKRAGVQGVHAHRFRRTCATMALRRGMPLEMVSMMLGHEQLSTTQIYLDLRESDLKSAHEKFVM